VFEPKGAAKALAGKSFLSGYNLPESSPSNPTAVGMEKQQVDSILWESISILIRIFQGFEEANLMLHALKQIEKENLVNNYFGQRKFLRKMSWQNRAHFWTNSTHRSRCVSMLLMNLYQSCCKREEICRKGSWTVVTVGREREDPANAHPTLATHAEPRCRKTGWASTRFIHACKASLGDDRWMAGSPSFLLG